MTAWWGYVGNNWGTLIFGAFNGITGLWACLENIGLRNSAVDIWMGLTGWMWVPVKKDAGASAGSGQPEFDWQGALFRGYPAAGEEGAQPKPQRTKKKVDAAASAVTRVPETDDAPAAAEPALASAAGEASATSPASEPENPVA